MIEIENISKTYIALDTYQTFTIKFDQIDCFLFNHVKKYIVLFTIGSVRGSGIFWYLPVHIVL